MLAGSAAGATQLIWLPNPSSITSLHSLHRCTADQKARRLQGEHIVDSLLFKAHQSGERPLGHQAHRRSRLKIAAKPAGHVRWLSALKPLSPPLPGSAKTRWPCARPPQQSR